MGCASANAKPVYSSLGEGYERILRPYSAGYVDFGAPFASAAGNSMASAATMSHAVMAWCRIVANPANRGAI